MKRSRAFSFVEVLIAMIVIGLLGGTILTALWFFIGTYGQNDEYVSARLEIEEVFQFLTPQITNVGLGMPNNRSARGSFNAAFKGDGNNNPIMEQMGDTDRSALDWGGPITLGTDPDDYTNNGKVISNDTFDEHGRWVYVGPVLYYTWAIPTGVLVSQDSVLMDQLETHGRNEPEYDTISNDQAFWSSKHTPGAPNCYTLHLEPNGVNALVNFKYRQDENRPIGIENSSNVRGSRVSQWIVFPSTRAPLLIYSDGDSVNSVDNTLKVQVAPYSFNAHGKAKNVLIGGRILGYEEVHLIQSASLFVNDNNELIQRVFMGNPKTAGESFDKVLARNIAGVCFRFDPDSRLLTLYIAAFGANDVPADQRGLPPLWPNTIAPYADYFKNADQVMRRRIIVESMIWRIRN
ncbi:MAG: prepilin-type N-terminal cleavage/methylation domain-containing protein [Synergistaceae bacterium]|jgi:hypothetical protein|nr:prepilin-type N-terminal cleavage/methylation domain-containing protein [Synergistaceae bacterium]